MNTYPHGYSYTLVTLDELRRRHAARMHPEFARRLFAWLEHRAGWLGIGGGYRATGTQPEKPGFAPEGKSFHQDQQFATGVTGYAAVDLVHRTTGVHRSPTPTETADAHLFGLHFPVRSEPWHVQPVEIRGWQTWVDAGRPAPTPGYPFPKPPTNGDDMTAEQYAELVKKLDALDAKVSTLESFARTQAVRANWLNNTWTGRIGQQVADIAARLPPATLEDPTA